jgi:hypothetical protein
MTDPIKPDPLSEAQQAASETTNTKRDGESALEYSKRDNGQWVPMVIGGSVLLIAAGFFLGRHYLQLQAQTPTDRFLNDLQDWVEERSSGLPPNVRDKLNATVEFLGNSIRSTPSNQVVTRLQHKPRRLYNFFS